MKSCLSASSEPFTLSVMAPQTERIVAEALALSTDERAEVAHRLLASLDADGDDLDVEGRERLHAAIGRSEEQFKGGQGIPADEVLKRLRTL